MHSNGSYCEEEMFLNRLFHINFFWRSIIQTKLIRPVANKISSSPLPDLKITSRFVPISCKYCFILLNTIRHDGVVFAGIPYLFSQSCNLYAILPFLIVEFFIHFTICIKLNFVDESPYFTSNGVLIVLLLRVRKSGCTDLIFNVNMNNVSLNIIFHNLGIK